MHLSWLLHSSAYCQVDSTIDVLSVNPSIEPAGSIGRVGLVLFVRLSSPLSVSGNDLATFEAKLTLSGANHHVVCEQCSTACRWTSCIQDEIVVDVGINFDRMKYIT